MNKERPTLTGALLYSVEAVPGMTASQWASRLDEDPATVSSLLLRLYRRGAVERRCCGPRGGFTYHPGAE